MIYDNVQDFVSAIRECFKENPNAYFTAKDIPKNLLLGIEALMDNADGSTSVVDFMIHISKFKNMQTTFFSPTENQIITNYYDARAALTKSEHDYINLFTGKE
jgi:hypothetical protein